VPGAEHDAPRRPAVEGELMHRRPVRMAVDQGSHAAAAQRRVDRRLIRVHDLTKGALRVALAALAGLFGQAAPQRQRQCQETLLPARAANHAAQQLIGPIGGTQRIAVRDQHRLAIQIDDQRIGDQASAGAALEAALVQEVAIAMHRIARHAAPAQARERGAHALAIRLVVVIADPGFKQIAEYVERLGSAGARCQKIDELRAGRRLAGIQMQVGDEQCGQGGSLGADS